MQSDIDWISAYNVGEMSQEIVMNHRKISAISELLDVFSNISIFKGKVVSYTDSVTYVVEVELDKEQILSAMSSNKVVGKDDAIALANDAHLWITIPPDAVFYPYSSVFVEDQLVQIYQGDFDLSNDD